MVILTPENFDATKIIVRKETVKGKNGAPDASKIKVKYLLSDGIEDDIEISNSVNPIVPASVNGMNAETNYTTKKPTGNYKPGFKLVKDPKNPTDKEKLQLAFYDKLYQAIKEAMKKEKSVCPNPVLAETLESFVKFPAKRENGQVKQGEIDETKSPAIWAKPYYSVPKDVPKESLQAEDITPLVTIVDEFGTEMKCKDLENKAFLALFKMKLYGIELNPQSGGKVLSWRLTEMKVKVTGDSVTGGHKPTITAGFD